MITVLGICLLPLMLIGDALAVTSGYILYPLLDFFVRVVVFIGSIARDVSFEVPAWFVSAYYILLLIVIKFLGSRIGKKSNNI